MEQPLWELSRLYSMWREEALIEVVFQPLVHIPSGEVFGFEALSRPQMNRQPVPIELLLESAAKEDQLSDFDRIAFPVILAVASQHALSPEMRLFVNFSPFTLLDSDFILGSFYDSAVSIQPSQIVIEISERESLPDIDLDDLLRPYRNAGISIALDDYGAGYSGLNRLVSLQPDYAKIDLGIVRNVDTNSVKHALVESTVQFASRAGHLQLLAEGIETEAELLTLAELGINFGQGFLLGRPAERPERLPQATPLRPIERHIPDAAEQLQAFLTTSHRLVNGIGSGEGIASHIVHLASRLLAADHVSLWAPDDTLIRVMYSFPSVPLEWSSFHFDARMPSYEAMTTRTTIIYQTIAECAQSPFAVHLGLQAMMIVPITSRTKTDAVLMIGYHRPLQIRPQDVRVAEGLARLMALGAPNTDDAIGVGEPIFEAISTLVSSGDLDSLLAKVMEAALSVSGGHLGFIGILTDDSLHAVTADGDSVEFNRSDLFDVRTIDGAGPVGQILQQQQMMVIPDIVSEPTLKPWLKDMLADGIQAAIGIPLIHGTELLGILKVYHSQRNGFETPRIRRLEALASLATTIIQKWQEEHNATRHWAYEKSAQVLNLLPVLMQDTSDEPSYRRIQKTVQEVIEGRYSGTIRYHQNQILPLGEDPMPESYKKELLPLIQRAYHEKCFIHSAAQRQKIFVLPLIISSEVIGAIWIADFSSSSEKLKELVRLIDSHLRFLSLAGAAGILLQFRTLHQLSSPASHSL